MTKQKKIGLVIPVNEGAAINARYLEWTSQFGNVIFINPMDETIHDVDLLIIPGGSDVNPARYGEKPSFHCQKPNPFIEWFDENILPQYIENNIPIFGICRAFQSIAVMYGVKLTQHVGFPVSEPRWKEVEHLDFKVNAQPTDRLYRFAETHPAKKNTKYGINSLHHQCFYPDDVQGTDVVVLATSAEFGNVEVARIKNKPIFLIQFHAEETDCTYSNMLVKHLLQDNKVNAAEPAF